MIAVSDTASGHRAPTPPARRRFRLLRELLGAQLRRIRLEQHRTLSDVAVAANLSLAYLSEIERGLKEPSSEVLAALCAALDIRLSDLLEGVQLELERELQDSSVIYLMSKAPITSRTATPPTACAA